MSLLMKALEKAAKDRGEARAEEPAAPAKAELALEPIAAPAAAPPRAEPAARPAAAAPPTLRPDIPARPAAGPPRPAPASSPPPAAAAPSAAREQAQASTILQAQAASRPASGGVGAYIRARPVMVIGTVAGIFAAGFGAYVYLQIFNPGFFVGQPAVVAKGPPPPAALKPPAPAPGAPLATETVLKDSAAEGATAPQAVPSAGPQPAPPTPAPEEAPARGNTIVVSPGSAEPVLNPLLGQAYAALQAGESDAAQRLYSQLLTTEPRNVDALLALAALAGRNGNTDEAVRLYLQILELEPRHVLAQSGLIALLGRADPLAAESKLKQLIAREPSSWLYFTLGNLYADQSLWAPAQQAYFQAHHLEPSNPDYAYNLAVGLEHVSQPGLALSFYRRAVQLAAARGRANFNVPLVQERIGKLAQQVE